MKLRPSPVSVIVPMTIPADAHARATTTVLRAPDSSASPIARQPKTRRVLARSHVVGTTEAMPHSAANAALRPPSSTTTMTTSGRNRWPRSSSTVFSRGRSALGTPTRPIRLASKCTAMKTAT